jgi:hypothetical protein
MSSDEKTNNYVNHVATGLLGSNQYATLAVAGAALFGGALYYYLNNSSNTNSANTRDRLIDFKNQTREIQVKKKK